MANCGNNTVTLLTQTGAPASGSPFNGNGLLAPAAMAIDASGNTWVADKGGTSVSVLTSTGGTVSGSPFAVGTAPAALAFDTAGNVFVANSGSNNITELSASGAASQTISAASTHSRPPPSTRSEAASFVKDISVWIACTG